MGEIPQLLQIERLFLCGMGVVDNMINTDTLHNQLSSPGGWYGLDAPLGRAQRGKGRGWVTFGDGMGDVVLYWLFY